MTNINLHNPDTALLDEDSSIYYRVDSLEFCGFKDGRLHLHCCSAGRRPVTTDSFGALYSRMEAVGGEIQISLLVDFVAPQTVRLKFYEGTNEIFSNLPFMPETPATLKDVQYIEGEDDLSCLRFMGEKRGFQVVTSPTKYVELRSTKLRVRIYLNPYRIEYRTTDGNIVAAADGPERNAFCQNDDPGLAFVHSENDNRALITTSFDLGHDEAIYGYGERFRAFGHFGREEKLFHADALGTTTWRSYKNVPFFLSSRGYGIYVNTAGAMRAFIGSRTATKHTLCLDDDILEYFFIWGPDLRSVLGSYTSLTGKAPELPAWSYGMWMSRCTYKSDEEVSGIVDKLRERKIGCDVINLDPGWMAPENWRCNLQFNPSGFADPVEFMQRMAAQGIRICLWQLPYIPRESELYPTLAKCGAFGSGNSFAETVIDYSNPDAIEVMRKEFTRLFTMGAAVIKTDFGEEVPLDGNYAGGTGRFMHNMYPFLYNRAVFSYTQEARGEGIVWARSAWAGSQRHPLHWGGDATSDFPNLAHQLVGALNFGLSGFTYWSSDIAGITGVATPELYVRWTQFGVFNTHMRFHSGYPVEPWNYGDEAEGIVRTWIAFRYRLLPYLLAQARLSSQAGLPMMRPLVLHYQDDPNVRYMADEYLFGEDLLIAPVLTPGGERQVYLPAGDWYAFQSGLRISSRGEWLKWKGGLAEYPIFVRAGTVIPIGPSRMHTGDNPNGEMTLLYYPGPAGEALCVDLDETVSIRHIPSKDGVEITVTGRCHHRPWQVMIVDVSKKCTQGEDTNIPSFDKYILEDTDEPRFFN
jgi:alpha-D-xyloside xylohydrolase